MSVLLALTLIYAAILVLALATGLIAIVYFLNGARSDLKQIANGLRQVNKNVEPLKSALSAANEGLGAILTDLSKTSQHLGKLDSEPENKRAGGIGA
jgi:predicted PurR-regulated permease PerM